MPSSQSTLYLGSLTTLTNHPFTQSVDAPRSHGRPCGPGQAASRAELVGVYHCIYQRTCVAGPKASTSGRSIGTSRPLRFCGAVTICRRCAWSSRPRPMLATVSCDPGWRWPHRMPHMHSRPCLWPDLSWCGKDNVGVAGGSNEQAHQFPNASEPARTDGQRSVVTPRHAPPQPQPRPAATPQSSI